ncbi:MAG: ABC transporter permease [Synergistaceae bacterium]|jgi:D-methionine transport system permease protein|nr:ABC transporter permease [Synergistaceae bacterium]
MSGVLQKLLLDSLLETLFMISASGALAVLFGVPLGVVLTVTARGGLMEHTHLNRILSIIVNAARSTPFVILMVAIIPLTRFIVGTSIGTTAAIVPLFFAALPFMGRVVEGALKEVDDGVVEASQAMGAAPLQIVLKVLLPEALPGLVSGVTLMLINLVGYSAMAGTIGGGGLGDLAMRYGYQRFRPDVMAATVLVLIVLVQGIQSAGDLLSRLIRKKRGAKA